MVSHLVLLLIQRHTNVYFYFLKFFFFLMWTIFKVFIEFFTIYLLFYVLVFLWGPNSPVQFSSVAQLCPTLCNPMNCSSPGLPVHHQIPESSQTHIQWVGDANPTISSSVVPFSSCPQSFPASGSFQIDQPFASGGQSIGVSASTSVPPMHTQDWSPLRWTGWISLQSKGLSRVFSNTTVQKHQFFGTQLSSQSNSHIHTWPLEKP